MYARNDARVNRARALTNSKRLSYPSANRNFEGLPRSLRILVADDERDSVWTLATILRDEGHAPLSEFVRAFLIYRRFADAGWDASVASPI
jgi:hypothetical protein